MPIKINRCKQPLDKLLTIEEFSNKYKINIIVDEREQISPEKKERFYASFEYTEIKDDTVLYGTFGNGKTPEDAIIEYSKKINGKLLVINAYTPNRKELWAHLKI